MHHLEEKLQTLPKGWLVLSSYLLNLPAINPSNAELQNYFHNYVNAQSILQNEYKTWTP